ncbi:N-terminal Xaa-Pro-Lys N-methyltransferase 1-like [Helicoverpa armigera]|uniref:N-terminal Xaa-Pro-Lys N-methyltransferase 1-like n=1 Tax=Helicoverpa armigera TaxID=29058 RepID=UPI0030827AD3
MTESLFYKRAALYWANVPATVDGVLGGFGHISEIDLDGSRKFLDEILALKNPPDTKLALDCGAGIGRVTKHVLLPRFEKVDLVEQDEKFLTSAKDYIGADYGNIESVYNCGLQNFKPQKTYDLIWCQWVSGHLKDYDLIDFLERCRISLNKRGMIIIKENIATSKELEYDEDDSSVTRPIELLEKLIQEAKLKTVKKDIQKGFPDDIYPVHTLALIGLE